MTPASDGEVCVRLRVRLGHVPPHAWCGYAEIRGGLQRKDEVLPGETSPDGLPYFICEVRVRRDASTGAPVFLGPYTFGPPTARFLYVSWSAVPTITPVASRAMFRRMKVPLTAITWAQVKEANARPGGVLQATAPGIARDGGPACASVSLGDGWRVATSV